ncbi:MAG TPA: hypothetical protein VF679_02950, partial [Pedobacter sp.]
RVIGFDPCRNFLNWPSANGAGFVIEVESVGSRDTFVSYNLPAGLFDFQSQDITSSFLFTLEAQERYKVAFAMQEVQPDKKTSVICNGMVWTAPFTAAVKGREIILSCVSRRQ